MAVYTKITQDQLETFLEHYDLGDLVSFEGVEQGVSNTNYLIETGAGKFVLTLYEPHRVRESDLPFFLEYTTYLADHGIPCPAPVKTEEGLFTRPLADRPAVIVPYFSGDNNSFDTVTPEDCLKAGQVLAEMHVTGISFPEHKENDYGVPRLIWWLGDMEERLNDISPGFHKRASEELVWQTKHLPKDLPNGAVHADYFPDNVLFERGEVSGVLDFHFACTDFLAYDLAIAINAWSFSEDGEASFHRDRYEAFLTGYQDKRALHQEEIDALPVLLRVTALRTALARSEETLNHDPARLMVPHDPLKYIQRLDFWRQ